MSPNTTNPFCMEGTLADPRRCRAGNRNPAAKAFGWQQRPSHPVWFSLGKMKPESGESQELGRHGGDEAAWLCWPRADGAGQPCSLDRPCSGLPGGGGPSLKWPSMGLSPSLWVTPLLPECSGVNQRPCSWHRRTQPGGLRSLASGSLREGGAGAR